ncbi:MAG TPA: hypothetical protein VI248_01295 [Kineosporiaceae bacterium]
MSERLEDERLERALAEWEHVQALLPPQDTSGRTQPADADDAEVEAIRMAILLEDVSGLVLSEATIRRLRPHVVADRAALRLLLSRKDGR